MTLALWLAFLLVVGTLAVIDLGLVTRRPRVVTPLEALASFSLWVMSAVCFSLLVWYVYEKNWLNLEQALAEAIGPRPADLDGQAAFVQWITAYVIELALSLDNIAIAALLVRHFRVPAPLVGRVLFWTTLFSLVGRWLMVLGGASLLRGVGWMKWVFCGVLVFAMLRTLLAPDEQTDFNKRWTVRMLGRLLPVSSQPQGLKLFTRVDGRLHATPILLVVLVASVADLSFAVDSVPALFSVTREVFLAFTASAFALLGLRSLYFALSGVLGRFRYLRVALVFVLLAVAGKMFLVSSNAKYYENAPTLVMLAIVSGVMALGVGLSALRQRVLPSGVAAAGAIGTDAARPTPLEDISEAIDATRRNLRKVFILIAGSIVILIGIAIAPLPGPGPMVLVPIGLAILATEFIWAQRLLGKLKEQTAAMAQRADAVAAKTSPWLVAPIVIAVVAGVVALAHFGPFKNPLMGYMIGLGPLIGVGYWAWKTISSFRRAKRKEAPPAGLRASPSDQR